MNFKTLPLPVLPVSDKRILVSELGSTFWARICLLCAVHFHMYLITEILLKCEDVKLSISRVSFLCHLDISDFCPALCTLPLSYSGVLFAVVAEKFPMFLLLLIIWLFLNIPETLLEWEELAATVRAEQSTVLQYFHKLIKSNITYQYRGHFMLEKRHAL